MIETELKFQVPASQAARLRKALATSTARTERLEACYYDTPDRALATARMALRLRREGDRWVQTVKGGGPGIGRRLEHEVPLPGRRAPAGVRLDLHDVAAPVAKALREALGEQAGALQPTYRVEVRRLSRRVRVDGGIVEVAFDEGVIRAGERQLPVCEVEFELKEGDAPALLSVAAAWARRHGLWLDPRSKAERGERLVLGVEAVPALKSQVRAHALAADATPAQAVAAMVDACLRQVLANAAEIADGQGLPEHVHQLRVGLRRLRSVLRTFGAWTADPAAAAAAERSVRPLFAALGTRRDRDVVAHLLSGPLHAGGHALPALPAPAAGADAAEVVRSADFAAMVLQALAFAMPAAPGPEPAPEAALDAALDVALEAAAPLAGSDAAGTARRQGPRLRPLARKVLARLWKRIEAEALNWSAIEEEQRHDLRKRAKRLRYALEFVAPLFPARRVARFLAALAEAQDAIGAYNDIVTAADLLRPLDRHDPAVAYASGWVASQRADRLRDCERPLRRLVKAPRPWASGR